MINKQLAGLLILPAMIFTINASHALSNSATQNLQATLGTYLDITVVTDGAVTTTTISPDTGALAASLISKFQVISNTDTQQLYLKGTTAGSENALFEQQGQVYAIFSNTATGKTPTAAAIADCKKASPTAASNPNAIAYPINVALTNSGSATYDATNNQYNVTANIGTSVATTTTGTAPYTNTYSYADNAGTYQAVMKLTSSAL